MKTVEPGMDVARQRRKISCRVDDAPTPAHADYLRYLLGLFDASVDAGQPRPAREFLPMYHEEFDLN